MSNGYLRFLSTTFIINGMTIPLFFLTRLTSYILTLLIIFHQVWNISPAIVPHSIYLTKYPRQTWTWVRVNKCPLGGCDSLLWGPISRCRQYSISRDFLCKLKKQNFAFNTWSIKACFNIAAGRLNTTSFKIRLKQFLGK